MTGDSPDLTLLFGGEEISEELVNAINGYLTEAREERERVYKKCLPTSDDAEEAIKKWQEKEWRAVAALTAIGWNVTTVEVEIERMANQIRSIKGLPAVESEDGLMTMNRVIVHLKVIASFISETEAVYKQIAQIIAGGKEGGR